VNEVLEQALLLTDRDDIPLLETFESGVENE